MNRRYSRRYRERCELLREVFRQSGTDNGCDRRFSGETEEEFAESNDFVDTVDFYETHIFKYSRRAGTKAAAMDGQLPEAVKAVRSAKMIELHHRHAGRL